jgi:haloacid dehalogenase-like hydrolase/hemerythrin HHE cation binding domain-containing protein
MMDGPSGNSVKVVFFDVRDTLADVDRPGHLAPYRPSTENLLEAMKEVVGLRIGVIWNLPDGVTAQQGREMLRDAVLSENGHRKTLDDFIDPSGAVFNHDAGRNKPDPAIYRFAADRMGVRPEECLFVSENLIETLAAAAAGMRTELKPSPPGKEFQPAVVTRLGESRTDSGRAFEQFLEQEHLLGERIFECCSRIAERLKAHDSDARLSPGLHSGIGLLVYLTENFADQAHFAAEEAVIPLAIARGMEPARAQWVLNQHDQARAYWRSMAIAWKRITTGDVLDRRYAIDDMWRTLEAFVALFRHHGEREDDDLYPEMGKHFDDVDDTFIINLLRRIGPADFGPYVTIVARMEEALGIGVPAPA